MSVLKEIAEHLEAMLREIRECDNAVNLQSIPDEVAAPIYEKRRSLVTQAMAAADLLGYETGYRIDTEWPEWPVAYIELPTGQVSWHMPQHVNQWDGSSPTEKYQRIQEWIDGIRLSG